MLLDEPKKGKGKTLAQNKQRQQKGNQKHSVRCIKQKPVIATNAGPTQTCTEVSTMPIDEGNVGNKMLRSMGWSTGTGLGLMAQGQVEPVPVVKRLKRRGLGA